MTSPTTPPPTCTPVLPTDFAQTWAKLRQVREEMRELKNDTVAAVRDRRAA